MGCCVSHCDIWKTSGVIITLTSPMTSISLLQTSIELRSMGQKSKTQVENFIRRHINIFFEIRKLLITQSKHPSKTCNCNCMLTFTKTKTSKTENTFLHFQKESLRYILESVNRWLFIGLLLLSRSSFLFSFLLSFSVNRKQNLFFKSDIQQNMLNF